MDIETLKTLKRLKTWLQLTSGSNEAAELGETDSAFTFSLAINSSRFNVSLNSNLCQKRIK